MRASHSAAPLRRFTALAASLALAIPLSASAATINYDLISLGANSYQYQYTVTNDSVLSTGALLGFDIFFDPLLYDEPTITFATPAALTADWSELAVASDLFNPYMYDVVALGAGIPFGGSVGEFLVNFDWLGQGAPGNQPFEIYDPSDFAIVASGTTEPNEVGPEVPEPGSLALLAIGLLATVIGRRIV